MRLINADELIAKKETVHCTNGAIADVVPVGTIRYAPTVDPIHAAGGCYCRECRWYLSGSGEGWCSEVMARPMPADGYCSFGERREREMTNV